MKPEFKFAATDRLKTLLSERPIEVDGHLLSITDWLPKRANETDTGFDVRAAEDLTLAPFQYFKLPLGVVALIPEGWWLELRPRSSTFMKKKIHNLYGTIDQDFAHQLHFVGQYIPDRVELQGLDFGNILGTGQRDLSDFYKKENSLKILCGERIGQLVPIERVDMDVSVTSMEEIEEEMKKRSATRNGGFGSSGNGKI